MLINIIDISELEVCQCCLNLHQMPQREGYIKVQEVMKLIWVAAENKTKQNKVIL